MQVEESQEYISKCFEKQQGDIDKILATNTRLEKENIQLNSSINNLHTLFYSKQEKRIQLEQYGHQEMTEVSGILVKENENCIDIIKRLGSLIGLNVNNSLLITYC